MEPLQPIPIQAILAARERIAGAAIRTPLVRLNVLDGPEIYLKLENLQPIGSFKIRGAGNALAAMGRERLERGVYTASAGNMAQGVAWCARLLGVRCRVIVPETAPETKLAAIQRLGGEIIKVSFDEWWQVMVNHGHPDIDAEFVHPVSDPEVMAGNGTVAIEILEDLPDVATVLVPYGGGGLSCGIASAIRAVKPEIRVFACEVATAAPLAASLQAGTPTTIDYTPSWVDGIGSKSVLAEMWPLVNAVLDGALVVPLEAVAGAVRVLAERNRVVAEGAGATAVAAALAGLAGEGKIVCVISGGNIDAAKLGHILLGEMLGTHPPEPVKAKAQSGRGRRTAAARAAAAPANAQPEPEASVAPAAEVPTTAKAPRKRATRAKAPAGA
jgi:threonine dehydratase